MSLEEVEYVLSDYLGRRFCFLVGRGTTAIDVALRVIGRLCGVGEVILPTVACPSIAQSVLYAGFTPVFAVVSLDNFTLDADSVKSKITAHTRAILPVHLFGHAASMREILFIAEQRDLYVVEDAAQGLGGTYHGHKLGTLGHFSILSFGGTKIVSAGGGGAIAVDRPDLAELVKDEIGSLPAAGNPQTRSLKELSHRNLYHALVDLLRTSPDARADRAFAPMIPSYQDLYRHRFGGDRQVLERIVTGMKTLDRENGKRIDRARRYEEGLSGAHVTLSRAWSSGVVWRYTLLIDNPMSLLEVTARLRKHGINASNHYWSIADLLKGEKGYPNTSYICPRILNLWVDDTATQASIDTACNIVLQVTEEAVHRQRGARDAVVREAMA